MESILSFLRSLSRNNNREWFEKNKGRYLAARSEFEEFIARLCKDLPSVDPVLAGTDPKKSIFRIYRDVRFSKDKRPYKTNFAAAFSASGKGLGTPGYYLHIEPGGKSMVAGGLYMPEAEKLAKVRQEIDYNGESLHRILSDKKFRKWYDGLWDGDRLKTVPRGYPKDHPDADLLRLKSFIAEYVFPDDAVKSPRFYKSVLAGFGALAPLNAYLTEAIS
ncbi:MAG TPA: DUF2461 domain-containing protein [Cyclobacteriaceae bacterium]|nr:DUF2461 domain-containing protein [Cyclobacteriaceae bacterium]